MVCLGRYLWIMAPSEISLLSAIPIPRVLKLTCKERCFIFSLFMKYHCYRCIARCFLEVAPKGEPYFLWGEETNLLIFYLRKRGTVDPASTAGRERVGLRRVD